MAGSSEAATKRDLADLPVITITTSAKLINIFSHEREKNHNCAPTGIFAYSKCTVSKTS